MPLTFCPIRTPPTLTAVHILFGDSTRFELLVSSISLYTLYLWYPPPCIFVKFRSGMYRCRISTKTCVVMHISVTYSSHILIFWNIPADFAPFKDFTANSKLSVEIIFWQKSGSNCSIWLSAAQTTHQKNFNELKQPVKSAENPEKRFAAMEPLLSVSGIHGTIRSECRHSRHQPKSHQNS